MTSPVVWTPKNVLRARFRYEHTIDMRESYANGSYGLEALPRVSDAKRIARFRFGGVDSAVDGRTTPAPSNPHDIADSSISAWLRHTMEAYWYIRGLASQA